MLSAHASLHLTTAVPGWKDAFPCETFSTNLQRESLVHQVMQASSRRILLAAAIAAVLLCVPHAAAQRTRKISVRCTGGYRGTGAPADSAAAAALLAARYLIQPHDMQPPLSFPLLPFVHLPLCVMAQALKAVR